MRLFCRISLYIHFDFLTKESTQNSNNFMTLQQLTYFLLMSSYP